MSRNIRFVNSLAGQPSTSVPIGDNVTLGAFLEMQDFDPSKASVRVGRESRPDSYILQEGDVVYISPLQVKGA